MSDNPPRPDNTVHITRETFNACYHEIRDWLDIQAMQGYLMKHGLLATSQDMHYVKKTFSPWDQLEYVYSKARRMRDGYHRLYLCIRESQDLHMGHKDAADVLEEYAREHFRPPASRSTSCPSTTSYAPSTASSTNSTTSYPPSTTSSSSSTPSSDSFPPPQSQLGPPSAYQPAASEENLVTLENRSCSSRESLVAGDSGAGRLSEGRLGMSQRPRSQSNEEGRRILKNCSPVSLHNTRGPIRLDSAAADLDSEVELDQASSPWGSLPPSLCSSVSSFRRDSDGSMQEIPGRGYEGDSSLPSIQDLLTRGDSETLYKSYHGNGYDIEFDASESEAQLFDSITRFLVAIFNGRDRERYGKGLLIAGVNVTVTPPAITGVTVNQDNFLQILRQELKQSVGIHGSERELSEAELGCVEHEFTVTQSEATLLCVSVSPSWEARGDNLYYCREGEGKRYWRQVEGGRGQLLFHSIEKHKASLQSLIATTQ